MRKSLTVCLLLAMVSLFCLSALAQTSSANSNSSGANAASDAQSERITKLEQAVADAKSSGDNAWMLTSSALVLMMTGPGLALFYGGLVRKKNVLSTMLQSFALMAIVTLLWGIAEYSLAFGSGNSFIGGLHNVFLRGVGAQPDPDYAATIPLQTYMIYQLMFAIITPALITGAFAERMKFSAMTLFMILWSLIVYAPMAHMVWGKGGFLNASLGGHFPTLDFAGGTVVHVTSGVSALVCALYLGRRLGYPKQNMTPHSVVLSFIGACLLWVGWFGFNAGSALVGGQSGDQRFRRHPFWRRLRRSRLECRRVVAERKTQCSGSHLGSGGGISRHYTGRRFCVADVGDCHRVTGGSRLLLHGGQGQDALRL